MINLRYIRPYIFHLPFVIPHNPTHLHPSSVYTEDIYSHSCLPRVLSFLGLTLLDPKDSKSKKRLEKEQQLRNIDKYAQTDFLENYDEKKQFWQLISPDPWIFFSKIWLCYPYTSV